MHSFWYKISATGSLMSSRQLGGTLLDLITTSTQFTDGSIIISGQSAVPAMTTFADAITIKLTSDLNIDWVGLYGGAHTDNIIRTA